jgi:hypothetical protein
MGARKTREGKVEWRRFRVGKVIHIGGVLCRCQGVSLASRPSLALRMRGSIKIEIRSAPGQGQDKAVSIRETRGREEGGGGGREEWRTRE